MEDWRNIKLGEISKIQTGPFGSQLHQSDYVQEGVPCIMPVNISSSLSLNCEGIAKVSEIDAKRLSRHRVRYGDIVYSRRGDIERCAFIDDRYVGWLCGTGCLKVGDFSETVNPKFIALSLSLPKSRAWLVSNAVGTTMLNLNTSILGDLPLRVPSLKTQTEIVNIIESLDDKIELNNQINHNFLDILSSLSN